MTPRLADAVVYRHACDCKNANTIPSDGHPEHRFEVDGQPFPWHISEDGARFTRVLDDLYRVDVTIFGILRDGTSSDETISDGQDGPLMIAGREFPWAISIEGITYTRSTKTIAALTLGFFATSIDTDGDVLDKRLEAAAL